MALVTLMSALQGSAQMTLLDMEQVRVLYHANGMIAMDPAVGEGVFRVAPGPDGQGPSTMFAGSLWIGGEDASGALHLAAVRFQQMGRDFFPGPLSMDGSITQATSEAYDQVWKVDRQAVDRHRAYFDCAEDPTCNEDVEFPDYEVPASFLTWPAQGDVSIGQAPHLAPFFDRNGNGHYDPLSGDAPCVPGDQSLFSIYNDKLQLHTESGGTPIGVEVHATPFAFASQDPAIAQTVFIRYRLINRGPFTLSDTYLGLFNDFDLGCSADDQVQCDAARSLMIVMNATDLDEPCAGAPGFGAQPPAFGLMVLKGPLMDADGEDNTDLTTPEGFNGSGFNDGVADNERLGLSFFGVPSNTNMHQGDPTLALSYYNYMRGYWLDQTPFTHGGSGYSTDPEAVRTRYLFPGDSDPDGVGTGGVPMGAWTEASAGLPGSDRRVIGSIGPFTFGPGAEQQLVVAYVYARPGSGGPIASVEALRSRADSVRSFAENTPGVLDDGPECFLMSTSVVERSGTDEDLQVFPNPAQDALTLRWSVGPQQAVVSVLDVRGVLLQQRRVIGPTMALDISELAEGPYLLRVQDRERVRTVRFIKQ